MEEQLHIEVPAQKTFFGLTSPTYLRAIILLLIYTSIFFFVFYYGHSNTPNEIEFFWSQNYVLYFLVALTVSIWRSVSQSFYKQLLKVIGVLLFIDLVAMFVPAGFGSLGEVFIYFQIYALPILITSLVIFYLTSFLINWTKALIVLNILFLIPLIFFIYANNHDLGVKNDVQYQNNSMFDSIDKCSAYIYKVREDYCRRDYIELQRRFDLEAVNNDKNLIYGQTIDTDSENYKFFPKENIKDIVVGTGEVAKIDNTAVINVQSANIRGHIYSNLVSVKSKMADPGTFTNKVMKMYNTYVTTADEYSYSLGMIGMKVGGIREITFKSGTNFWFRGVRPAILIKANEPVTYRVELLSLVKGLNYYQENLTP